MDWYVLEPILMLELVNSPPLMPASLEGTGGFLPRPRLDSLESATTEEVIPSVITRDLLRLKDFPPGAVFEAIRSVSNTAGTV